MKKAVWSIIFGVIAGLVYRTWGGLAGVSVAAILLLLWCGVALYYRRQLDTLRKLIENMDEKERLAYISHASLALQEDLSTRNVGFSHKSSKRNNCVEQAGAGYPSQGVGHPDP